MKTETTIPTALADPIERETYQKILIVCDAFGGTLHVHFLRPLTRLRQSRSCSVRVMIEAQLTQIALDAFKPAFQDFLHEFRPDVAIMSRCGGVHTKSIADALFALGIPIIGHLDDNLFHLPKSIGEGNWRRLMNPDRIRRLHYGLQRSKVILTSTPELADQLAAVGLTPPLHAAKIPAGGQAIEFRQLRNVAHRSNVDKFKIGYMGGPTHIDDFTMTLNSIVQLLEQHDSLQFELFGGLEIPMILEKFKQRIVHHPQIANYDQFLNYLQTLNWDLGLAPLCDTRHNMAKTNTKWVEYTLAGIPVLASNLIPYQEVAAEGGAILCGENDWKDAITSCLVNRKVLNATVEKARELIAEKYSLLNMEKQLCEEIHNVTAAAAFPSSKTNCADKEISRRALIVLGMHRSGTSFITGLCHLLGVAVPRNLLPPQADNPTGFWESREIVQSHNRFLQSLGIDWSDYSYLPREVFSSLTAKQLREELIWILRKDFTESKTFVIKDPRICRLLPLWDQVFDDLNIEPLFISVFRNPSAVAASLTKRNGFECLRTYLIWLRYVIDAEQGTRQRRRCFLEFDAAAKDWTSAARKIERELDFSWPVDIDTMSSSINQFVRHDLMRNNAISGLCTDDEKVEMWANATYEGLCNAAMGDFANLPPLVDRIAAELSMNET